MTEAKRKRGRPKGSKTKVLPSVPDVPAQCPTCGCTEYKVFGTPRHLDITGEIHGNRYDKITWRRCKCERCGQIYFRRTYRAMV